MTSHETILYISDHVASNNSVVPALRAAGYDVVDASSTQAIALAFVLHCIGVVVLNQEAGEQSSLDVTGSLREICPGVPILMLVGEERRHLPPGVDLVLNTKQPLEQLTSAVRGLLAAKLVG
jgi:DNA-binding response OmpR family regulator